MLLPGTELCVQALFHSSTLPVLPRQREFKSGEQVAEVIEQEPVLHPV